MEIKHVLIICSIWTLEGPHPWFSERKPRDWEQRQPLGANFTVGREVWESVVLQPLSPSAGAQGKGPRPAEAGTGQQGWSTPQRQARRSPPWVVPSLSRCRNQRPEKWSDLPKIALLGGSGAGVGTSSESLSSDSVSLESLFCWRGSVQLENPAQEVSRQRRGSVLTSLWIQQRFSSLRTWNLFALCKVTEDLKSFYLSCFPSYSPY